MSQQFLVRHLPSDGTAVNEEVLSATSTEELRSRLEQRGSVVLELRPARAKWTEVKKNGRLAARRFDVAWWCRELEALLSAGMNPVEAIETLASAEGSRAPGDARAAVHLKLVDDLRRGAALSEAMRRSGAFPEILRAGVAASERTSTLAAALNDYLRYDELLDRLRRQAASAALYPAVVVAMGALIAAFLLLFVIPRFSRIYGSFSGQLSAPTEWVLGLSVVLRDHGWVLVLALLAIVVAGTIAWRRGTLRTRVAEAMESMALMRQPLTHFRLAQFYQAVGMLVRGGYTVDEALAVASGMALGAHAGAQIGMARQAVARGRPVSAAFADSALADPVAERLLSVGERGGDFARILMTIADRHSREFTTFVERATRLLEPLLLLITALVVGALVVMMYMPIFDIAGGLRG